MRPDSTKSYGSWANNVRPYGSAGADEFTNGVPRSYPRAPSLVALPQQSESTTERAGTRVAVRPWAAIANPGRHTPNPKERQASTRPIRKKEWSFNDEIYQHGPFVTIYCHLRRYPAGAQNHTVRGRTLRLAKSRLRRLLAGRPLRWVCSPYGIYGAKPCLSTNKRSGFIT